MDLYEFKLNFQYSYVNMYSKDLSNLIQEFVMNLYDLFKVEEVKKDYYHLCIPISHEEFKSRFKRLKRYTEALYKQYQKIYGNFTNDNEIFYSSNFLNLTDKCGRMRRNLEKEYPIIHDIYSEYNDNDIINRFNLQLNNKIGTGVLHLKKFYKLLAYIKDNGYSDFLNYSLKNFEFDAKHEFFFFKASNDEEACVQANYLENILNKNIKFRERFGAITILPMYDTLRIIGDPTEFEYTIVFPNGNPSDIKEALQSSDEFNAQTTTKSFKPEHGKKLNGNNLNNKILNQKGINGYLQSIKCKGAKFIKKIKTKSCSHSH